MSKFHTHTFANGLTLLGEELPHVSSAAVSVLVPAGSVSDPEGAEGAATVLSEMLHRGAGPYDNRTLSDEYEKLGTQASHSAGTEATVISTTLLSENLSRAIELVGLTLRKPTLPESEFENAKLLALQELRSLEDEPASKVMVELAKDYYPAPFGRCQLGTIEGIEKLSLQTLTEYFQKQFVPNHGIIGVAGKFNWSQVVKDWELQIKDWSGSCVLPVAAEKVRQNNSRHIFKETTQLQIALAFPSVSIEHPDYYTARVAVGVLSGGMAGRLFIEVREKRGLVYRVSASHSAAKNRAAIFCYAGTTTERAEETLTVMLAELRNLGNGVTEDELKRSKADLKSKTILQSESSSARASSIVSDFWNLKRIRSLDEIKKGIDAVTSEDVVRYLKTFPVGPITLVTLGQKGLTI